MKDKSILFLIFILIIGFSVYYYKKDNFYNIQESQNAENDLYFRPHTINNVVPADKNVNVTVNDLSNLLKELLNVNGPPGGANINVTQNKYDLLFKDILVCSDKRNVTKYPNPNNYNIYLNINIDKIYFFKEGYSQIKFEPKEWNLSNSDSWWFEVATKKMVVFPSSLTHMVQTVEAENTRISLAFNTFFKGTCGLNENLTELILGDKV